MRSELESMMGPPVGTKSPDGPDHKTIGREGTNTKLVKRRAKCTVAPSAASCPIVPLAVIATCAHKIVALAVVARQIAVARVNVSWHLRATEDRHAKRESHSKHCLSAHCHRVVL